jgi:ATP-dependent helicase/nuclease subunit A
MPDRFYAIACDPRRSVVVEACAGAGKTWMLVSRMVRALLDGCAPHEILAITFTKKAAGEMRERLHDWLLEFSQADDDALRGALRVRGVTQEISPETLEALRQLHGALLRHGRPVQIRTFHSWFAALVRSAPLSVLEELGLPAQYELLENDRQAVTQVWRRFHTRIAKDASARADYVDSVAQYGRYQTLKGLEAALNKRVEFALADAQGVVDQSVQTLAERFPDYAGLVKPSDRLHQADVRQRLQAAASALGASTLATCTKQASALELAMTTNDSAGIVSALLTQKSEPRKFSEKLAGLEHVREAQELLMGMAQAQTQHDAWLHQQRMARLMRGLADDYAALKRERGWIDMGDLERAALALMSDPFLGAWVQERLDARVRHLLIDEFQDTNPLQWQALSAWLDSYSGAGRAPSVFIVGDPKQSIYRFRRAEPQVFQAAKLFVAQGLGGDVLSCDHTRRNALAVMDVVNAVMTQAQDQREFEGFRTHSTASTANGRVLKLPRILRDAADASAEAEILGWRDSLTVPRHTPEETRKTLECRQAAQWLAAQLADGRLHPRDVLVLARKRERLGLMQEALAELHIPAQQPEKIDLSELPEVQDIVALLDVLVSQRHDLSLARALKSPIFGASDDDLVEIALRRRAEPTLSWWQILQQPGDLPDSVQRASQLLARWKGWLDALPVHDALNAIVEDGDVLARYAASAQPSQVETALAHIQAVLQAALAVDGGRYPSAYAFVRALRAGGLTAPVRADRDAVRLLTIHGAKGLEAPLVLILDTDGEAPRSESMGVLVDWPGEAAYPESLVFLASESRPSACVADALAREQAARKREELNALYVATTRAKSTLVISSVEPHSAQPASWWQRLEGLAADAEMPAAVDVAQSPAAVRDVQEVHLKIVPKQPAELMQKAQAAIKYVANQMQESVPASLDARIGLAMHRLLEWAGAKAGWTPRQLLAAQTEFELDATQATTAREMAQRILQGEGAWAWDVADLSWQGNEVGIAWRGKPLRMDRLVQRRSTGEWWVLDYKSAAQPLLQPELLAQLQIYRDAVAAAQPGEVVRAAFLTAQGALMEMTSNAQ